MIELYQMYKMYNIYELYRFNKMFKNKHEKFKNSIKKYKLQNYKKTRKFKKLDTIYEENITLLYFENMYFYVINTYINVVQYNHYLS